MKLRKWFSFLFLILLAAAAVAAYMRNRADGIMANRRESVELFQEFDPEDVRVIEVSGGGSRLRVECKDNVWVLPESENACASRANVIEFLTQLSKTKPLRELESADAETLKNLNLSKDPDAPLGYGGGIHIRLENGKNEVLTELTLGKAHLHREAGALFQSKAREYDGRYVRKDLPNGESRVYLISRVFERCMPAAPYWLEQLRIQSANSGVFRVQYVRRNEKGEPALVWSVVPDMRTRSFTMLFPAGKRLMLSELARRLDILTSPFSRDVIPAAEAEKIVFRDELSIWCSGGMSYTLSMAKLENGDAAAKLHTELVPGRLPRAAGESDHDYELRQKQQAVNAEYEKKAYNGRVFRIKADLMDLLASVPAESETGK